ncbi:MAG: putative PHD type zinc finger protein with BAH domain-containing protein [Alyxoria varia]|nr:MAG: putative PHD type zinc finger protein with BAH domain-containing protein [Alyxoria varia]
MANAGILSSNTFDNSSGHPAQSPPVASIKNSASSSRDLASDPQALETAPSATQPASPRDSAQQESDSRKAEHSQSMTRTTSRSSTNSSIKDQNLSDPAAPYGTRSRNRGNGPRPNYADEPDLDLDVLNSQNDSKGRAEPAPKISTANGITTPKGPTTIRLKTGATTTSSQSSSNFNAASSGTTTRPGSAERANDRKKRKHDRPNPLSSNDSGAHSAHKESIPGTSQFPALSVAGADSNVEQPPSKKRKTSDGLGVTGPLPSRKASMSCPTRVNGQDHCVVTFEKSGKWLKGAGLEADDGTVYTPNDHVYLVCEPPGDPYYLCRIMEFRHVEPDNPKSPVDSILVNWFYRPRDIGRHLNDPRFLFASMQSDVSPLTSLRGKCRIKHRSEIQNLEEFRKQRNAFWFSQLYDRYSHRPYEIIPSSAVINVPDKVKRALDERWQFLVVEPARQKELTSAVKLCKRCSRYCAPNDSVDCGVCHETYHMACVSPPLAKKPSRGFAWSCGPCSRAQERKLQQRHATLITDSGKEREDEAVEEEEDDAGANPEHLDMTEPEHMNDLDLGHNEFAQANMWPWRYLGIHCRVEDVLQFDDRAIYPRASSRLGPRHQANVAEWFGQPVQLVKPADSKKKFLKSTTHKKDSKLSKDAVAAIEAERRDRSNRPKWVQEEPPGYVARGEDYNENDTNSTITPLFVKPLEEQPISSFAATNSEGNSRDNAIEEYMRKAEKLTETVPELKRYQIREHHISTDFLDHCLRVLMKKDFDVKAALDEVARHTGKCSEGEPQLNDGDVKKFENAVAKFGSDLRSVRRHVKTRPHGEIVRFYYTWKSSPRGLEVRGRINGKKGSKKRAEQSWVEIADEEDDSAFDNDKAIAKRRRFQCVFCTTRYSRQWRRAPNVAPGATVPADPKASSKDKVEKLVVALCQRCAVLWRRYALRWEDPDEVARSLVQSGGRAWKRKNDEEMLRELVCANEAANVPTSVTASSAAATIGITVTVLPEATKKKAKPSSDKESTPVSAPVEVQKKKPPAPPPPRPPTPPPEPAPPKWRKLPCAVCRYTGSTGDELLSCKECKLSVHRRCYSISDQANAQKWVCDTCVNDKNPQHSLWYQCALCPVANREVELVEPPKVSHKKKTERDREKERLEKELAQKMEQDYLYSQRQRGRPQYPREALKSTASHNWMHVTCAVWTPEIKFGDASKMEPAEGMDSAVASSSRVDSVCKMCQKDEGTCVTCHHCHAPFHIGCAHEANYRFGFDVSPVKGSRKDTVQSVTLGTETGSLTAAIWCPEHAVKTIVHNMTETVEPESGLNALQIFVQTYKQADLALTGTARKANLMNQSTKTGVLTAVSQTLSNARRSSGLPNGANGRTQISPSLDGRDDSNNNKDQVNGTSSSLQRRCGKCGVETSLKWHRLISKDISPLQVNGMGGRYEERPPAWQCHKCHQREMSGQHSQPNGMGVQGKLSQSSERQPDFFELTAPSTAFWSASSQSQHPQPISSEIFAKEVESISVTVTNPKHGGLYVFRGKDLGLDLIGDPTPAYRYVVYFVQQHCKYDPTNDVILDQEGFWVTFGRAFVQALVKLIYSTRREAHWKVASAREVPCKPMTLPAHIPPLDIQVGSAMHPLTLREPPPVPPSQLRATAAPIYPLSRPTGAAHIGQHQQHGGFQHFPPSHPSARNNPSQPPWAGFASPRPTDVNSRGLTTFPNENNARPATPTNRNVENNAGGASSSPNLKNLMH